MSFGAEDQTKCWRGENRRVLQELQQRFAASDDLSLNANAIRDHLAADGAMPVIGEGVLVILGWTVFWTGFIVAFPYSARLRAFYLFNEKARGALTLWFVPAIMTLLPLLRRRMLLPFRDDLLADARLDMLDEREWFACLCVQDRTRAIWPIEKAIPEIRGRMLLIGESGLGKTTFLRVLAKRSRRTLVFLNARSCEKGIEDAILQRVSNFQSADFFRGLIYSGDLLVVIDGLNEVNADIRANIVAFTNRPGKSNLLIATQPIEAFGTERSPLTGVTSFELLPLPRAEIAAFLKSRKVREDSNMPLRGAEYD